MDHSCQVQRHNHVERGLDLYETPSVASMNRQRHIDMILHLIEVEGFAAKDFFLTAPRARDRARERERRRIAHIMRQYGCTAHDLVQVSELPAADGAGGRSNASAPRKRVRNGRYV